MHGWTSPRSKPYSVTFIFGSIEGISGIQFALHNFVGEVPIAEVTSHFEKCRVIFSKFQQI